MNVPQFVEPRIAATDDNRFVMVWENQTYKDDGWLEDIYYTIRDTKGGLVKDVTKFTNGVAGDDYYQTPALTSLSGNRALLAYYSPSGIAYAVINSAGSTIKAETSTGGWGYSPDAVQLSDENILVAWQDWDEEIVFAVLDGATYNKTQGPTWLNNPAAVTGDAYVSVTADGSGRAILTWMDYDYDYRRNLYYALVNGDGDVLTDPMIFRTSQSTDPRIETSYEGYGNTSYSDDTLPTSQAASPEFALDQFQVTWSGSDVGFGVASYDVQVRDDADETWNDWLVDTTAVSATYTAFEVGHTYCFRSVAEDFGGNVEEDVPSDGDDCTTIAAYKAEGQVVNNLHEPVFNATVSTQPDVLNVATTDGNGEYELYLENSGTYTVTVERDEFGTLPPYYGLNIKDNLSGENFVIPPENNAVTNGGWETGDLSGWNAAPGLTPTVEMIATHTGYYGVQLESSGSITGFHPHLTQTVSIPPTWTQPTLSFVYHPIQGEAGEALLVVASSISDTITHSASLTPNDWTHAWLDLSALSSSTATLHFGFSDQSDVQQVYLDEISVGEAKTGVYSVYLPLVMRNH